MALQLKTNKNNKKIILITVGVVLLALSSYFIYAKSVATWPFNSSTDSPAKSQKPGTSISVPEDNETPVNPKDDLERNSIEQGGNTNQGQHSTDGSGISDTGGVGVTHQTGGIRSSSGQITLYTPTSGQKLSSGIKISGASSLPEIQYRISDTVRGQIAQGTLSTSGGLFSGTLVVTGTSAKSGTFEVYSFNSEGQEVENIKIEIKY
ncbi:MAG: hypothetical protein ACREGE_00570 [Candidatus Microsaccharimonas sp.]